MYKEVVIEKTVNEIKNQLDPHKAELETIADLLAYADDQLFNVNEFGYRLAGLIKSWLEKHSEILDEVEGHARKKPECVLYRAESVLLILRQGAKPSHFADFNEVIENLEEIIRVYGEPQYPSAMNLLKDLKEFAKKGAPAKVAANTETPKADQ